MNSFEYNLFFGFLIFMDTKTTPKLPFFLLKLFYIFQVFINEGNFLIKFHAAAFGWCGDLKTAFCLVDEMIENKVEVSTFTINFLLQACVSDKEAGFRHALLVS